MSLPFAALTVPLDASAEAEHAAKYAIALAAGGTTTLHFCSVVDPAPIASIAAAGALVDPVPMLDVLEAVAHRLTDAAIATARVAHVAADADVLYGGAASAIAQAALQKGSGGIVICTHARNGFLRFIAGSVTERILTLSTVPLIVLHHDDDPPGNGPITVAIDGSSGSNAALEVAISIASAGGQSLALLHVVEGRDAWPDAAPILQAAAERVRLTNLDFELVTLRGDAAETIAGSSQRRRSPFVVMGTRGRSGIARILGSVAESVIERSRVPVVIVRKPKRSSGTISEAGLHKEFLR